MNLFWKTLTTLFSSHTAWHLSFGSTDEALKSLRDFANDTIEWDKGFNYGEEKSTDNKLAFIFGGQGLQWHVMGRQLIEDEPVFKEAVLTVDYLLNHFGQTMSLIDELMAPEESSRLGENCIAQPATFAVQYAIAQLLMSWRIRPFAVLGQSLGEIAAACVAGVITVKEAVQLVMTRAALHDKCPSTGGMAALGMSEEEAVTLLTNLNLSTSLDISAVNHAKCVTVPGDAQSIDALGQYLATHTKDTFWRVFTLERAFHSSYMEIIKQPFQTALKHVKLKPKRSKIPVYSTVAGKIMEGQQFNSYYWWQNLRFPVQLYPAMRHLLKDGYKQIIEISTQPMLARYVKQIANQEDLADKEMPVVLPTLPPKRVPVNEQHKYFLRNTVCELYTLGLPIDWKCVEKYSPIMFERSQSYP